MMTTQTIQQHVSFLPIAATVIISVITMTVMMLTHCLS
jgi:hypothetical protein